MVRCLGLLVSLVRTLGLLLTLRLATAQRAELHVHWDGAVTTKTLLDAAQLRNLSLPTIGKPTHEWEIALLIDANFGFKAFDVVNDILGGDAATLALASERFVDAQAANNVTYTEVRYDPARAARSSYANASISQDAAVAAVRAGLRRGMRAHPGVVAHQILCAMRGSSPEACGAVADLAARSRSDAPGGVVGIDLAGDEWGTDNARYVDCFRRAKADLGLNTTVHVGETLPWPLRSSTLDDVVTAALDMRADRLGHGYAAAKNATALELLRDRGVHLEACPTTAKGEGSLDAIAAYKAHNLSFSINRDDPCIGCGDERTAAAEEAVVVAGLGFDAGDLDRADREARRHAFGSGAA